MYNDVSDTELLNLGNAIMRSNPQGLSAAEWAGVAGVGVAASMVARNILPVVALGAGMYVLGYYVRGMRPESGWGV